MKAPLSVTMVADSMRFGELTGVAFEDCADDEIDSLLPAYCRLNLRRRAAGTADLELGRASQSWLALAAQRDLLPLHHSTVASALPAPA